MGHKIHKLLREMVERKGKNLNEGMKIFKSDQVMSKQDGPGFWLYLASDLPEGNDHKEENLRFSGKYNFPTKKYPDVRPFVKKWGFIPPEHTNTGKHGAKAWIDPETGQWGYGYFILKAAGEEYINKKLDNLNTLRRDYNINQKLDDAVEGGDVNIKQVGQIEKLVSSVENAMEMNPETKAKLESYLDELTVAIENDEVFDFLTKRYNEAKHFIRTNRKAGTSSEGHDYTVTNTFIILAVEPSAMLAAQKNFWLGRNYQIKPGAVGITIRRPGAGTTDQTAAALTKKPGAFDAYKQEKGIDPGVSFDQHRKANPRKHDVDMALSSISQKAVQTKFSRERSNFIGVVYTDTMVEPIPGKEVVPIKDLIGNPEEAGEETTQDPFHVPQKELDSAGQKQKINALSKILMDLAEKEQINTVGISLGDGDINEFNKLMNAISYHEVLKRLPSKMGIKVSQIGPEIEEMLLGYSEVISNLVKQHYGIPSEESKYNVARQGIDREEMEKMYSEIVRASHDIVNAVDTAHKESLNEVRKIVRQVLRKQ